MRSDDDMVTRPAERVEGTIADRTATGRPSGDSVDRRATEDDRRVPHDMSVMNQGAARDSDLAAPSSETAAGQEEPRFPRGESRSDRPEVEASAGLFNQDQTQRLRERWTDIQGRFVDDPRTAVKEADAVVAEVMKRLTEIFSNERTGLERQWDRGDKVTTEDLRVALQRYHAFFDRLLEV